MKKLLLLATLTAGLSLALISSAGAATYGGSATGAEVTVPATGTTIRAATGSLSISGGGADAALLVGDIPGSATAGVVSLSAGVMHSAIVGLDATRAEASTGDVSLTVSGNQITADFLMARSAASCGPAVTGSSELSNLVINGQAITVTGAPNQTVALPNGTAIINEQISSIVGTGAELIVNALHVTTTDAITHQLLADVLLSAVDAKIDCSGGSTPTQLFVTGGGWIVTDTGGKGTFGFVAGNQQDGSTMGHLVYRDHSDTVDLKVQSLTITYAPGTCTFSGTGTETVNGTPYDGATFTVDVRDNGQGSTDTFQIQVTTPIAYSAGPALLSGGNIQSHNFTCP